MVTLTDLFPAGALDAALEAGLVRAQTHPALPLTILNYSEKCAFAGMWSEITLACRGLIIHTPTGEIVARPYLKVLQPRPARRADHPARHPGRGHRQG